MLDHVAPTDWPWIVGALCLAIVFGLTGIALVIDAAQSRYRIAGVVVAGVVITIGFVVIALLVLHWAAPNAGG